MLYHGRHISTKAGFKHVNATFCRCGIVHGDVTPHNIFLDTGYNALLGDIFHGDGRTDHAITTNAVGTLGYEDRYRSAGDPILVSEDLFSLGIGLLFVTSFYTTIIGLT